MMLNGKTAIVTGAAGAAGLAAVRVLIEDGAQVGLVDADALRLDSLIRFLRGTTVAVPCDSADPGAVRQAFAQIEKVLGPVDILVNASDVASSSRLESTDPGEWRRVLAAHADGAFNWAYVTMPGMKKRAWGRIVNVLPPGAKNGGADVGPAYAAAGGIRRRGDRQRDLPGSDRRIERHRAPQRSAAPAAPRAGAARALLQARGIRPCGALPRLAASGIHHRRDRRRERRHGHGLRREGAGPRNACRSAIAQVKTSRAPH